MACTSRSIGPAPCTLMWREVSCKPSEAGRLAPSCSAPPSNTSSSCSSNSPMYSCMVPARPAAPSASLSSLPLPLKSSSMPRTSNSSSSESSSVSSSLATPPRPAVVGAPAAPAPAGAAESPTSTPPKPEALERRAESSEPMEAMSFLTSSALPSPFGVALSAPFAWATPRLRSKASNSACRTAMSLSRSSAETSSHSSASLRSRQCAVRSTAV
mmetsp:Transcript_107685/g.273463  ORF Transcript_107685/g.273463 Transcript_107685/m.273463 type:complete len:214 (+) Transcript_107685:225-866(+)